MQSAHVTPMYDEKLTGKNVSKSSTTINLVIGIATVTMTAAILGITIATLVKVRDDSTSSQVKSLTLESQIRVEDVMDHLHALQDIADRSNGNRAVTTIGFNRTLDYIRKTLVAKTNFKVTQDFFYIRQFELASNPSFRVTINGAEKNYIYDQDPNEAEFYHIQFSTKRTSNTFESITVIPNLGCSETDWQSANPPPAGRVVLVRRGICAFDLKGRFANQFNASGILIYNDGATPDRVKPLAIGLGQDNRIPALFLSFAAGIELFDAATNDVNSVTVQIIIEPKDLPDSPVGNICADTLEGSSSQTIVIGSHSDSVTTGPGINDNGSGSAANLELAATLARLYQQPGYLKFPYRVRFCWWGAEEIGLLGSEDHVDKALKSNVPGERLSDYLINLNYDMLASPNFMFGVYDASTAPDDVPQQTLPGSQKITDLFMDWFDQEKLPYDSTEFDGRSDYGPFLAEGIVCGGLFSGADDLKTKEQRDRYDLILGQGLGGISGIIQDPCYHEECDSIANINVLALDKMIRAAAAILEKLGHTYNLEEYLYPAGRPPIAKTRSNQRKISFAKKYFGMIRI